uniref:Uncharacterized protein n=1 Tax=Timema genevievae TaxID=629358 RepID=A0A7R9K1X1_TIMGE|nr:unnamed protein product [Timema genevievae]
MADISKDDLRKEVTDVGILGPCVCTFDPMWYPHWLSVFVPVISCWYPWPHKQNKNEQHNASFKGDYRHVAIMSDLCSGVFLTKHMKLTG